MANGYDDGGAREYDLSLERADEANGYDAQAHTDYINEAYGDPCPTCGSRRFGGDCGLCYHWADEIAAERAAQLATPAPAPAAAPVIIDVHPDDIPF